MSNSPRHTIRDPLTPILVVDDSIQFAQILKRSLQTVFGDSEVVCVDTLKGAFALISERLGHFGLLFIDFNFPNGETGAQLLQRLKGANLIQDEIFFLITADPSA